MLATEFKGNFRFVFSQVHFSSILFQFMYDFGLKVHLITYIPIYLYTYIGYIGLHFLGFSWSKALRKGMDKLN